MSLLDHFLLGALILVSLVLIVLTIKAVAVRTEKPSQEAEREVSEVEEHDRVREWGMP